MLTKQDKKYINDTFDEKTTELRTQLKSDMFNYMDPFLQEIRALREETTIQFHHLSGHTNQLENHEERIDELEENLVIAV